MTTPQTEEERISYQALNWVLLLLCAIIWGFSYFFIKHSLTGFEPNEVLTLRALAAGIALLPFLYAAFKKIPRDRFKYVLLCTLLGNGIPMYIYPLAQTHISSSVTGIINSLTPFCVYIIGIVFYGLKNTRLKLIGVILGLLGAVCLIVFRSQA
jgi:drug/metabolite transporter (DMT)-like permease